MASLMRLLLITFILSLTACSADDRNKTANAANAESPDAQVPPFELAQVKKDYQGMALKVLDISERSRQGRNALAVTLSVPLNPAKDHQSFFSVSLKGGGLVDGAWVLDKAGKVAWFSHTQPQQGYEVTVYQGLTAGNGAPLSQNSEALVTTRDLEPSVNFDTNGAFLAKGLSNGLPVVTVNIEQVNIDFFRIKASEVQGFLKRVNTGSVYHWNIDDTTNFGDLVYSGRYQLDAPENTRVKRNIDIGRVSELQQSGVYYAVMQSAGEYSKLQGLWFSVTDLGLHARQYENRIDVHISSLKSGKPLTGIKVSLIDDNDIMVKQSKTTAQGLASFMSIPANPSNAVRLIVAQTADQYSVIQMRKPELDLSEFDLGKRPQLPVEFYIYAPRDLYRPGEVIDFSGLIRDGDGSATTATVLNGRIVRPDGSVLKHFKWQPQKLGYYHYNWQIPPSAEVGNWSLQVSGPLKQQVSYAFKVEEFLPERMKLSFNQGDKKPIVVGNKGRLKVAVLGEYLYGAPAAGNRLSTLMSLSHWRSPIESLKNYEFGDSASRIEQHNFELNDLKLNDKGEGLLEVKSQWQGIRSPLKVRLISSLYESGGRPVTRVYSALMWPAESLIGIRSSFRSDGDEDGGPEANSRVKFDIVKANVAGQLQKASNLEVNLIREDRRYFWVYNASRGWHYEFSDKEFIEVSQPLEIQQGTAAKVEFPVSYGHYRLEVKDPVSKLVSSVRFYAGHNWYEDWQNANSGSQAARPDKVTIALDKASYQAGDIAKATIVPPTAGEAIVMVEGNGPLWMERISVPKEGITIDIPVSSEWKHHNLYVTAVVLRQGDQKKSITPKRSFGLAFLPLDRTARKLQLTIDSPEKVRPQRTINTKINITDSSGKVPDGPVYITLAAVDVGVLSISNFVSPSPFDHFFGQRRYAVQSRDMYDQVIELNDAQKARLRFGGDADVSRGGKAPQSEVQIVSLFSGLVAAENGVASVDLTLPDFNGRLRLMAVAFSEDDFGHQQKEMTVAAPVVTQISMPRFLATGDKAIIALDVNNLSGQAQAMTVQMHSDGGVRFISKSKGKTASQSKTKAIKLQDKQKTTVRFAIEATEFSGSARVSMTLEGMTLDGVTLDDDKLEVIKRDWTLGLRPPYPALISRKTKILDQGERFTLNNKDIAGMIPRTVDAVLSVSAQANLNLPEQLKSLLAYPYGCLEQTSSRAFPLLYANAERQRLFGLKNIDESERLKMIAQGIDRISSMQRHNGGFGLWSNDSQEEHWLTAFVADFLLSARDMGIEVSAPLLDKTMRRLTEYVNRGGRFYNERWSEDRKHYTFAYKAYAAYVLSRVNQAPLGAMRTLFDRKQAEAKTGLPLVQLGLALEKMGDKKRGLKAIELGLAKKREAKHRYYGDYGSDIRDKAMMIHLLLDNKVETKKAIALSFELVSRLKSQKWLSTQERHALFMAGMALEENSNDSWLAKVFWGASEQSIATESAYYQRLNGQMITQGVAIESQNESPLFASATISGYGINKPPVESNGMSIRRYWYNTDGKALFTGKGAKEVEVGDLLIVQLQVSAEHRSPDALVIDLIPAGFELENQNLEHAMKLDTFRFKGKDFNAISRYTKIKHYEYRDDRYVVALDLGRADANVFYLLRAVTPGSYKVPAPLVEDMYNPQKRGVGRTLDSIVVVAP